MSADNLIELKRKERAEYRRNWYQQNKERRREVNLIYQHKHKQRFAELAKLRRRKTKIIVLTYYGKGKLICIGCGEIRLACLTIDHIDGKGGKHRRELKGIRGSRWYKWLIDNKFPKGYQTLCMNCQFVKREKSFEWDPNKEGRSKGVS